MHFRVKGEFDMTPSFEIILLLLHIAHIVEFCFQNLGKTYYAVNHVGAYRPLVET